MSDPLFFDADASVARVERVLGQHAARREPLVRALCDRLVRPLLRTRLARPELSLQFFLQPVEELVDIVHPITGKTYGAVVPKKDRRDIGMAWDRFLNSDKNATEALETFMDDIVLIAAFARAFNLPGEPAYESASALEARFFELWHASGVVGIAESIDADVLVAAPAAPAVPHVSKDAPPSCRDLPPRPRHVHAETPPAKTPERAPQPTHALDVARPACPALEHYGGSDHALAALIHAKILTPLWVFERADSGASSVWFLEPVEMLVSFTHPVTGKTYGDVIPAHDQTDIPKAWDAFLATQNTREGASAFRDDVLRVFKNARTFNQRGEAVYRSAVACEKCFSALWRAHIAPKLEQASTIQQAPLPQHPPALPSLPPVPDATHYAGDDVELAARLHALVLRPMWSYDDPEHGVSASWFLEPVEALTELTHAVSGALYADVVPPHKRMDIPKAWACFNACQATRDGVRAFKEAMRRTFSNARAFNLKGDVVYRSADACEKLLNTLWRLHMDEVKTSPEKPKTSPEKPKHSPETAATCVKPGVSDRVERVRRYRKKLLDDAAMLTIAESEKEKRLSRRRSAQISPTSTRRETLPAFDEDAFSPTRVAFARAAYDTVFVPLWNARFETFGVTSEWFTQPVSELLDIPHAVTGTPYAEIISEDRRLNLADAWRRFEYNEDDRAPETLFWDLSRVFSNALEFNVENDPVYESALACDKLLFSRWFDNNMHTLATSWAPPKTDPVLRDIRVPKLVSPTWSGSVHLTDDALQRWRDFVESDDRPQTPPRTDVISDDDWDEFVRSCRLKDAIRAETEAEARARDAALKQAHEEGIREIEEHRAHARAKERAEREALDRAEDARRRAVEAERDAMRQKLESVQKTVDLDEQRKIMDRFDIN